MTQSTEQLSNEIIGTRQKMASDLDALQDKVSPTAIVERRKEAARSKMSNVRDKVMGRAHDVRNTAASTSSGMADSMSGGVQNVAGSVQGAAGSVASGVQGAAGTAQSQVQGSPLAAGLVAFGAGMVIAGLFPSSRAEASAASAVVDGAAPLADKARSLGQEMGQDLQQTAMQAAEQVKETATESASRVADEGRSATETVKSDVQSS